MKALTPLIWLLGGVEECVEGIAWQRNISSCNQDSSAFVENIVTSFTLDNKND